MLCCYNASRNSFSPDPHRVVRGVQAPSPHRKVTAALCGALLCRECEFLYVSFCFFDVVNVSRQYFSLVPLRDAVVVKPVPVPSPDRKVTAVACAGMDPTNTRTFCRLNLHFLLGYESARIFLCLPFQRIS